MFEKIKEKKRIKESIDNLPTGIIFAKESGVILLANKKMYEIYYILTGEVLQSANSFWDNLYTENDRVKILEAGINPTLIIDNKSVYRFSKIAINTRNRRLNQIEAVDISELYELRKELARKNSEIAKIRAKMFETQSNLEDITRSEEMIDAKMKIHRTMGTGLANIRHYLTTGEGDIEKDLNTWKTSLELLDKDEKMIRKSQISSLKDASNALGIDISIEGEFPPNQRISKAIIWIAKECLINAFVHADAENMKMRILDKDDEYEISFENDGKAIKKELRPGGGFESIRNTVLSNYGRFEYTTTGNFVLRAYLPK